MMFFATKTQIFSKMQTPKIFEITFLRFILRTPKSKLFVSSAILFIPGLCATFNLQLKTSVRRLLSDILICMEKKYLKHLGLPLQVF